MGGTVAAVLRSGAVRHVHASRAGATQAAGSVNASGHHRPVRRAGARPGRGCRLDLGALLIAAHAGATSISTTSSGGSTPSPPAAPTAPSGGSRAHRSTTSASRATPTTTATPNSLLDVVLDRRPRHSHHPGRGADRGGGGAGSAWWASGCRGTSSCGSCRRSAPLRRPLPPVAPRSRGLREAVLTLHGSARRRGSRIATSTRGPPAVIARMLTNLQRSLPARGDRAGGLWAQCLPGAGARHDRAGPPPARRPCWRPTAASARPPSSSTCRSRGRPGGHRRPGAGRQLN